MPSENVRGTARVWREGGECQGRAVTASDVCDGAGDSIVC